MTILPSFLTTLILKTTLIWGPFSSFPGTTLVKVNNNLQQPNQRTLSAFLLPDLASTNVSIIFFNISWHSSTHGLSFFLFLFFFYFFLLFLWASPVAYEGSQARNPVGAVAAGLHQSHSNVGSKPRIQPTPQLTATLDP